MADWMRLARTVWAWLLLGSVSMLAACGGGSSFEPQVNAVRAVVLQYGNQATIYVGGLHLRADMVADFGSGCTAPSFASSSTTELAILNCTVVTVGHLPFTLRSASGDTLVQTSFTVPKPQVLLGTAQGAMTFELDPIAAPKSVDNFLAYVAAGFYKDTLFHRVIPGFVIQAGGFTSGMDPKTELNPAIVLESNNGLRNLRGTLAMARTSAPDSATSQFFINLVDNTQLDYQSEASPGYAVFGTVVSGMELVDAIAVEPTTTVAGYANVPVTDVPITAMLRLQ